MTVSNIVRDRLVELIDTTGELPWTKHWITSGAGGLPVNIISKKPYTGVNVALLAGCNGVPVFGTFKQITGLGCQLKEKEQRSNYICVWFGNVQNKQTEEEKRQKAKPKYHKALRYYNLFNVDDVILSDAAKLIVDSLTMNRGKGIFDGQSDYCSIAEQLVDKLGIELRYGDPACGKRYICMPRFSEFNSEYEFLVSLCHELGHYYSHEMELATGDRAKDEILAEISSVFIVNALGITITDAELTNNAAYVSGWRKKLVEEKGAVNQVMKACSNSQKITDHILSRLTGNDTIEDGTNKQETIYT